MNWTNIKRWAKDQGYTCVREKTTNSANPNQYDYYWAANDDVAVTGLAFSISSLAKDVFNHMTDNRHLEHQENYEPEIKHNGSSYQ